MRVLVIGGTNFIGPRVVRHLVNAGHNVTVFNRGLSQAPLPPEAQRIRGDHQSLSEFRDAFRYLRPHVVLNMILYSEQEAVAFMRTFTGIAERVVGVSSMDVYQAYSLFRGDVSGPPAAPFDEGSPLRHNLYPYRSVATGPEDWLYHYEKILVERVVMGVPQLPGTILRLAKVYGPGDKQHHFASYLRRIDDGRPTILLDARKAEWRWTRVYVDDAAAGIAMAVTSREAANRIYNLGEAEALTEAGWVERLGEVTGWEGRVVAIPEEMLTEHLAEPYDWTHHLVADTSRMREELGFQASVTRHEALQETVRWERAYQAVESCPEQHTYEAEDQVLERLRDREREMSPAIQR
jgi:nucleoside-diphosphate-sugar epimerase